jgi:hypothetical protein
MIVFFSWYRPGYFAHSHPSGLQLKTPYFSICTVIIAPASTSCMTR